MAKSQTPSAADKEAAARAEQDRVNAEEAARLARAAAEAAATEAAAAEAREQAMRAAEDLARAAATGKPRAGFARLRAPADVTAAGCGGESYEVDEDGLIDVPAEHVDGLLPHGFTVVE